MKRIILILLALSMIVTPLSAFAAYNIPYEGVLDNPKLKEMIKIASRVEGILYPPEKHPYIFVNDEYIAHLKANKDNEVYKKAYSQQLTIAKRELPAQPEGGIMQATISQQLETRAFMYVMGEVDEEHAKETVKYTIKYLANAKSKETSAMNIYKDFGNNGIMTGGLVYDWCYNVMTSAQKTELSKIVRDLLYSPQQPCRPDNIATGWQDINGKAVGDPLTYIAIGVSAVCDAYPDMYNAVMSKIQGGMAKAAKIYGEAGALTDGSINYSREDETYLVELLFQRMGHDTTELYGYNLPAGYMMLYSRLPYGIFIKYGDNSPPPNYVYGVHRNTVDTQDNMGLLNVKYEDPYLKHYYMRENASDARLLTLLTRKSSHEAKTLDDLPLAFESFSPRSAILAKTSWQEGLDSPQVSAFLNMNNRRSGDHDHADHGSFQLYYKGPLSIPGGTYYGQDWGKTHWKNYYTRTVSKSAMLVYEPGEVYVFGSSPADANDGGQLGAGAAPGFATGAGFVIDHFDDHFSDRNLKTDTIGTYIGPNEMTPAFSYIKGDLTRAYTSSKMDSFQRSMVFMDTFNETYPGMLVVFDHVVSTKSEYKKTFLLQAVAEPHIDGDKITIINSESNPLANGKLVNKTLLPEKANIESVGGIGVYIADGKEWPVNSEDSMVEGGAALPVDTMYASGWRAEISPAKANKEDIFLNAMFVADADTTAPDLEMKKVEDNEMVGVAALDRQIMFKKDGKAFSKEFTVNVTDNNAGGKMLVLLTDVAEGKWKVTGAGYSEILESKEYDNAFVFEAKPGKYTITPAGEDAKVSEFVWPQVEKEKIGDFSVKVGNGYQYLRQPTKLVNGAAYLPESFVNYSTECRAEREGNSLIITVPNGTKIKLTAGSNKYERIVNGVSQSLTTENVPFVDDDGFYFSYLNGIGDTMGMSCSYNGEAKSLAITIRSFAGVDETVIEGVDESKVLWPVTVYSSSDEGNVAANVLDRDLATRWSSLTGDNEWLAFEMGEEPVKMSGVQIAFYNGDKRNWKFDIEISNDGENWTKVLTGKKSAGQSKNPETFNFAEPVSAKFIRYVGHGEEVTKSFNNSLTEFIVINDK